MKYIRIIILLSAISCMGKLTFAQTLPTIKIKGSTFLNATLAALEKMHSQSVGEWEKSLKALGYKRIEAAFGNEISYKKSDNDLVCTQLITRSNNIMSVGWISHASNLHSFAKCIEQELDSCDKSVSSRQTYYYKAADTAVTVSKYVNGGMTAEDINFIVKKQHTDILPQ